MDDQVARSYDDYADSYGPYGTPNSYGKSNTASGSLAQKLTAATRAKLDASDKPRIFIVGLPRSGKSSIQNVIFHKVSPHETLFLESTDRVIKHDIGNSAFCHFQIWDFPGFPPRSLLPARGGAQQSGGARLSSSVGAGERGAVAQRGAAEYGLDAAMEMCSALIFVIDVTSEDTDEALQRLHQTITKAYHANPNVFIEVFIHKADALTEEQKMHCQRELQDRIDDELREVNLEQVINRILYRTTSIFNHSVFEAFSQVVQKLIPEIEVLTNLLDFLVNNSGMEKAFLFDGIAQLYVATDSTPVHPQDFELCSDMIQVVIDIGCIYAGENEGGAAAEAQSRVHGISNSCATIRLSNDMILYMREVSKYLALVCIIRSDTFDSNLGLIEYNVDIFKQGLRQVIEKRKKR